MISSAPELTPSRWREFRFVLNQVQRTIEPDMSLHDVLDRMAGYIPGALGANAKATTADGTILSKAISL